MTKATVYVIAHKNRDGNTSVDRISGGRFHNSEEHARSAFQQVGAAESYGIFEATIEIRAEISTAKVDEESHES